MDVKEQLLVLHNHTFGPAHVNVQSILGSQTHRDVQNKRPDKFGQDNIKKKL